MAKISLKQRIKNYMRRHEDEWINGGEIERLALENGYKGSTASRECRLLAEQGILQRKEERNSNTNIKSVWYMIPKRKLPEIILKDGILQAKLIWLIQL